MIRFAISVIVIAYLFPLQYATIVHFSEVSFVGIIVGMSSNAKQSDSGSAFNRFKDLARKLVQVPKKEVAAREAAYQRKKARKKRKSA